MAHMDIKAWLSLELKPDATLAEVNKRLSASGMSITAKDARMLSERRYDVYFAAHEVPCDIDYQLSSPVDPSLAGLDYIEAYLAQLLVETRWIAQFDVDSCISVLERICPDYRGLHVSLYDLLVPHEDELVLSSAHDGR